MDGKDEMESVGKTAWGSLATTKMSPERPSDEEEEEGKAVQSRRHCGESGRLVAAVVLWGLRAAAMTTTTYSIDEEEEPAVPIATIVSLLLA